MEGCEAGMNKKAVQGGTGFVASAGRLNLAAEQTVVCRKAMQQGLCEWMAMS